MKVGKKELNKPVAKKKDGGFATLKEVLEEDIVLQDVVDSEDDTDLSIARYEMMDPNKAVVIGGSSYTKDQIIEEIRRDTEAGKQLVKMQVRFVHLLLEKKDELEIDR